MKKVRVFTAFLMLFIILIVLSVRLISAETDSTEFNMTNSTDSIIQEISVTNFFPVEFKIGDIQFYIQVKNDGNETLDEINAFIMGKGYSTYNVIPIKSLEPGSKDYLFVSGRFGEPGSINLTIKIIGGLSGTIYQNVNVVDPNNTTQNEINNLKAQQEKTNLLNNLSIELNKIRENLSILEDDISLKKEDNYDVSRIDLNDLKDYIKNSQTNILEGNVDEAEVNINFAKTEYVYQKSKLENAKKVSILSRIKENAVLFSAIAGAIIMLFTLYELLKKKGEVVVHATTKIVRKKKKK